MLMLMDEIRCSEECRAAQRNGFYVCDMFSFNGLVCNAVCILKPLKYANIQFAVKINNLLILNLRSKQALNKA